MGILGRIGRRFLMPVRFSEARSTSIVIAGGVMSFDGYERDVSWDSVEANAKHMSVIPAQRGHTLAEGPSSEGGGKEARGDATRRASSVVPSGAQSSGGIHACSMGIGDILSTPHTSGSLWMVTALRTTRS